MTKRKVVSVKSIQSRLPVASTVILWLALDHVHAADWVRAVAWTLMAIIWIGCGLTIASTEAVDVFSEKEGK